MRLYPLTGLLLWTAAALGQSSQKDLEANLRGKTYLLRGMWQSDRLHFNQAGQLEGRSEITNPARSGVTIDTVELKSDRLLLHGHRAVVYYEGRLMHHENLDEPVEIDVAGSEARAYSQSLRKIFTTRMQDLEAATPDRWKPCLTENTLPHETVAPVETRPSSGITRSPVLLFAPRPPSTNGSYPGRYDARVLVEFRLDACGNPTRVRIVQGTSDAQMEETARNAVRLYRFSPGMHDGVPVPVVLQVRIYFHKS